MADLPMSMGQLPTIPYQGGLSNGLAQGFQQGIQNIQQQQSLGLQQQQLQLQKQQMAIQQVDTLLKSGIEYPALMKAFWKPIASTMNSISPDYGLNPSMPPEDLGGAFKFLSGTSDALQAGVISMPQAHSVIKQGLQEFKPVAVPSGSAGENDIPGQGGYQQKLNQLLSMGPTMAKEGLPLLEATPEAQQFKSSLEQQKALALQKNTIQNERAQSLKTTFLESSKDFQQVAPDFRDFSTLMAQPMPSDASTLSPEDKQMLISTQKAALLKYVQMQVPASRRPPNMGALDELAKGGEIPQIAEDAYNRLFVTGAPLTGKQMKAIRATGVSTYLSAEKQQSQIENSWAHNAKANGVDPTQILQDFRPSTAISSSQFFPSQSSQQVPLIGHVVQTKSGAQMHLGGQMDSQNNWANAINE